MALDLLQRELRRPRPVRASRPWYYTFSERPYRFRRGFFESPLGGTGRERGGEYPVFRWRDASVITNPGYFLRRGSKSYPGLPPKSNISNLQVYEDRRQWHPQGVSAPAVSFNRSRHRLTLSTVSRRMPLVNRNYPAVQAQFISFEQPGKVLVCVRRAMRKEVMHALGHAGGTGQKPPRYSEYSKVRCA